MQLLLLQLKNHHNHHHHHQQNQLKSLLTTQNHHHRPEEKKEESNVEEKIDISVNLKRRRDSGDSQVEEGDKKIILKNHNQKFKYPPSNNPRKKMKSAAPLQ